MLIVKTTIVMGLSRGKVICVKVRNVEVPSILAASQYSFGIVVRPAEYTIMLKPVQSHTEPKMSPNKSVVGRWSHPTPRAVIPIATEKHGTRPIEARYM